MESSIANIFTGGVVNSIEKVVLEWIDNVSTTEFKVRRK